VWLLLSFSIGIVAALGFFYAGLQGLPLLSRQPVLQGLLGGAVLLFGAWIPTWLVGRLNPQLSRATLLWYFSMLLTLFIVIAFFNMQAEL
jgi:hypothetical protein